MKLILSLALIGSLLGSAQADASFTRYPTRDIRLAGHSSNENSNGGGSANLMLRQLSSSNPGAAIIDFDRSALAEFLEQTQGWILEARLVLICREVQFADDPIPIEVACVDSATDWVEGSSNLDGEAPAGVGCYRQAQYKVADWSFPGGGSAAHFRDLFWDSTAGAPRGIANRGIGYANYGDENNQPVEIRLDRELLEHLATSEFCRGLVLYTQSAGVVGFYSREQNPASRRPQLIIDAVSQPTVIKLR